MSRKEFMERLAYLLQDMPEDEKKEALQYYYDYFDDAGEENEHAALLEFGSPERVAAIIRSEMDSGLKDGGEFTERGYHDSRFKEPNLEIANTLKLPELIDNQSSRHQTEEPELKPRIKQEEAPRTSHLIKTILWIILICTVLPILFGIGKGALRIVWVLFMIVLSSTIVLGVATLAMFLSGIGLFIAGITLLFTNSLTAVALFGGGVALLGVSFLLLALSALFYGRFLPFIMKSIAGLVHSLFRRRSKRGTTA